MRLHTPLSLNWFPINPIIWRVTTLKLIEHYYNKADCDACMRQRTVPPALRAMAVCFVVKKLTEPLSPYCLLAPTVKQTVVKW